MPQQCQIAVVVTPRSARPGIGGWRELGQGRRELEVRVAAAPADGAANDEVVALLARKLGIPRSGILVRSGAASRHKRLTIPLLLAEVDCRLG